MKPTLYGTAAATALISQLRGEPVSRRTVQRAAKDHGVGTRVGSTLALTEADCKRLAKLIPGVEGRHKFEAGNDLWKLGKNQKNSR